MSYSSLLGFLILFLIPFSGSALVCYEVLQDPTLRSAGKVIKASYKDIYASQNVVGKDYAAYKETRDAGLKPKFSLAHLSKSDKKKLLASIYEDLKKNPPPAVRDPSGRIFLLDAHHGVYDLTLVEPDKTKISFDVNLIYDAFNTALTMSDFISLAINNQWFYESAEDIINSALKVHELVDSVDRSMMGMVFLYIQENYKDPKGDKIPMKGKYFTPFVQFYLIDLIEQERLFVFPTTFQNDQVPHLTATLLQSPVVLLFWLNRLRPTAPSKLRQFLNDAYTQAVNAASIVPVAN